ncbi:MAG: DUF1566 domain-containing protein [Candidatus Omnitrophica bacterium]|nr:DUF1566 domain-containing protein [Candidatus Omnitrophota bacterium]
MLRAKWIITFFLALAAVVFMTADSFAGGASGVEEGPGFECFTGWTTGTSDPIIKTGCISISGIDLLKSSYHIQNIKYAAFSLSQKNIYIAPYNNNAFHSNIKIEAIPGQFKPGSNGSDPATGINGVILPTITTFQMAEANTLDILGLPTTGCFEVRATQNTNRTRFIPMQYKSEWDSFVNSTLSGTGGIKSEACPPSVTCSAEVVSLNGTTASFPVTFAGQTGVGTCAVGGGTASAVCNVDGTWGAVTGTCCKVNRNWNGTQCVACPLGKVWDAASLKCVQFCPAIGDAYQGGRVFYVRNSGGCHVLIAAPADQNMSLWGDTCHADIINDKSDIGNGEGNTDLMMSMCPARPIAASVCSGLNEGGYSDWYLPSEKELQTMYDQQSKIGVFNESGSQYLSSTVVAGGVETVDFVSGATAPYNANDALPVRCIRNNCPAGEWFNGNSCVAACDPSSPIIKFGEGTAENPYKICNCQQLQSISVNDKYYKLTQDIDCSATAAWNAGKGFKPIGEGPPPGQPIWNGHPFNGVFDGGGYKITGLTINRPLSNEIGLFGYSQNLVVRDLGLENVNINGKSSVGALAGAAGSSALLKAVVSNVYATGEIAASSNAGGLIGFTLGAEITNSYSAVRIVATIDPVGGLIGANYGFMTIINSYVTGDVQGKSVVGGIAGFVGGGSIRNCYVSGKVTGERFVGGIAGRLLTHFAVTNSYVTGAIAALDANVGGLAGEVPSDISSEISNFVYASSTGQSACSGSATIAGCSRSVGGMGYWSDKTNAPMSSWDYTNVWQEVPCNYPNLRNVGGAQNSAGAATCENEPHCKSLPVNSVACSNNVLAAVDTNYTLAANCSVPAQCQASCAGGYVFDSGICAPGAVTCPVGEAWDPVKMVCKATTASCGIACVGTNWGSYEGDSASGFKNLYFKCASGRLRSIGGSAPSVAGGCASDNVAPVTDFRIPCPASMANSTLTARNEVTNPASTVSLVCSGGYLRRICDGPVAECGAVPSGYSQDEVYCNFSGWRGATNSDTATPNVCTGNTAGVTTFQCVANRVVAVVQGVSVALDPLQCCADGNFWDPDVKECIPYSCSDLTISYIIKNVGQQAQADIKLTNNTAVAFPGRKANLVIRAPEMTSSENYYINQVTTNSRLIIQEFAAGNVNMGIYRDPVTSKEYPYYPIAIPPLAPGTSVTLTVPDLFFFNPTGDYSTLASVLQAEVNCGTGDVFYKMRGPYLCNMTGIDKPGGTVWTDTTGSVYSNATLAFMMRCANPSTDGTYCAMESYTPAFAGPKYFAGINTGICLYRCPPNKRWNNVACVDSGFPACAATQCRTSGNVCQEVTVANGADCPALPAGEVYWIPGQKTDIIYPVDANGICGEPAYPKLYSATTTPYKCAFHCEAGYAFSNGHCCLEDEFWDTNSASCQPDL